MDLIIPFARSRIPEITATAGLVTYATTRRKLTPAGVAAGILVAVIHMLHPWPAFFWLLMVFFVLGTGVTKIGHARKAHLTLSSTGGVGGEGARTSAQVFANSGFASILILAHAYLLTSTPFTSSHLRLSPGPYFPALTKLLPIGIIAQYAAVASDTFSSELGILARGQPFLITAPWRGRVARGTNGGVTIEGLLYGALGSLLLVIVAFITLAIAPPRISADPTAALLITLMGLAGSVIDSLLGALVQATVVDSGSGKVVEGPGGTRVKVAVGGSRARTGMDLLTNNGVNFAMAALAGMLAMYLAWSLDIQLSN